MESHQLKASRGKGKEFRIIVPWGHLSGLEWGEEGGVPVLLMHGIQHNAASFRDLVSLLPSGFYYVALDFPGHGASSHLQNGTLLHYLDFVMAARRVIRNREWPHYILIGHSLGTSVALLIAALYPENILKVVLIDGITPLLVNSEQSALYIRKEMDALEDLENRIAGKSPPSYTFQEALIKLQNNDRASTTESSARNLLSRALVPEGSGFRFGNDPRLRLLIKPLISFDQMTNFLTSIKAPVLIIIADKTFENHEAVLGEGFIERLRLVFTKLPRYDYRLVHGNHNVHLDYPERLAPIISEFLLRPPHSSL